MSHGWTSGSDSDSDSDSNSDYSESDSYKGIGAGVRLKTVDEQKVEQNAKVAQLKQKLKVTIFGDEDDELADLREKISQLEGLLEVIPENELQQQVDNLNDEIYRLQGLLELASNDDTSMAAAAEVSRLTGENTQLANQIRESAATHQSGLEEKQDKMTAECDVLLEERNKEYDARIAGLASKIEGLENAQTPDSSTLRDSLQAEIKRLGDENAKAVGLIKKLEGDVSGYVKEAKAQLSVIETCAQQLETATRTSGDWEARAAQLKGAYESFEALVVQATQQYESKVALL
ncbi:MAG: hypothetical protein QMC37_01625, partial [Flavobacteriales bacterium]